MSTTREAARPIRRLDGRRRLPRDGDECLHCERYCHSDTCSGAGAIASRRLAPTIEHGSTPCCCLGSAAVRRSAAGNSDFHHLPGVDTR
jgi:hypothetical protein